MPSRAHIAPLVRLPTELNKLAGGQRLNGVRGAQPQLDPYVGVEHFRLSQPVFPAHPHAGFCTVSYLFDDSETGLRCRDSLGFDGVIEPGDLHWTLAGSGLVHEEQPLQPGRVAHGLQLLVNLPAAARLQAPQCQRLGAAQMPRLQGPGWRARVVFGRFAGLQAPLTLPLQAALAVIDAEAGATLTLPLEVGEQGWALLIDGEAQPSDECLRAGEAFAFSQSLRLRAGSALRLVVGCGLPLREPLVQHGPFVMNTEAQIVDAMRRYQQGEMGRLLPL